MAIKFECSYDVDKNMYILCCSNRICACPSGRSCLQVTPPSGLCFDGVLIHFRSGKFQALDMSFFWQRSCRIFPWILAWLVPEDVGNIECPGFVCWVWTSKILVRISLVTVVIHCGCRGARTTRGAAPRSSSEELPLPLPAVTPPIWPYTNHTRKCVRSRSRTHGKISQHNSRHKLK